MNKPIAATFPSLPATLTVAVHKVSPSWPRRVWRKRESLTKLVRFLNSLRQLAEWLERRAEWLERRARHAAA